MRQINRQEEKWNARRGRTAIVASRVTRSTRRFLGDNLAPETYVIVCGAVLLVFALALVVELHFVHAELALVVAPARATVLSHVFALFLSLFFLCVVSLSSSSFFFIPLRYCFFLFLLSVSPFSILLLHLVRSSSMCSFSSSCSASLLIPAECSLQSIFL